MQKSTQHLSAAAKKKSRDKLLASRDQSETPYWRDFQRQSVNYYKGQWPLNNFQPRSFILVGQGEPTFLAKAPGANFSKIPIS